MGNLKRAIISALICLLLTINILPITDSFVSIAQTQSTTPSLEGTEWKVMTMDFYGSNAPFYYVFEQGKVKWVTIFTYFTGLNPPSSYYDRNLGLWRTDPGNLGAETRVLTGEGGTYKQRGNSIRIEFHDHIIDAVITGNRMEGEVRSKQSDKRAKWSAAKATKATEQNGRDRSGEAAGVIPNNRNSSLSPARPLVTSPALSRKERLPEQLGNFKRTSLDLIAFINGGIPGIDGVRVSLSKNKNGEAIYPKENGEVEGAEASYGRIMVFLTKFEDSAKATSSMQKFINSESSNLIVKRMPVKNRAGQSMGELVVLQGIHGEDVMFSEAVAFTYGVYFYTIYSPKLGEAQKIQELLPLE